MCALPSIEGSSLLHIEKSKDYTENRRVMNYESCVACSIDQRERSWESYVSRGADEGQCLTFGGSCYSPKSGLSEIQYKGQESSYSLSSCTYI